VSILGPSDATKLQTARDEAYKQGLHDGLHLAWTRTRGKLREMNLALGPMLFDIDESVTLHDIQAKLEGFRDEIRGLLEKP